LLTSSGLPAITTPILYIRPFLLANCGPLAFYEILVRGATLTSIGMIAEAPTTKSTPAINGGAF